jgi:large subunit ribosomal protein L30e
MPSAKKKSKGTSQSTKQDEEIDIDKAINMAVTTGRVQFGTRSTLRNLRLGRGVLILMVPERFAPQNHHIRQLSSVSGIPVIEYPKSTLDLGAACGRPHRIASLTIHDPGDSRIERLVQ